MGLLSDIQFQFLLGGLCVLERAERTGPPASPERAQPRDGGQARDNSFGLLGFRNRL
jgi:hypothetical protein